MPRDGSGNYNLPSGNPVVANTTISSTWANTTLSDLGTGLTQSISRDGQTTPTANLPMAGFKHTGVGNATNRTDYAVASQVQDGSYITLSAVSGTDTITGNTSPAFAAYTAGQMFMFVAAGANTTNTVTLNINGLGAKNVIKFTPGNAGYNKLAPGDIQSGQVIIVSYDGTSFELQSPIAQGSPFSFRNKLINGNFSIWQRGPSAGPALPPFYGPDRWKYISPGTGNVSMAQQSTGFANGLQGKYYLFYNQTSPVSSGQPGLYQYIEGVGTLSGKYVTLTIMASYFSNPVTINPVLTQSFGTGGSPSASVQTNFPNITLTNTPTVYSVSVQLPSTSGKTLGSNGDDALIFGLVFPGASTFGVNIYYVQLEEGGTPTPFEYRHPEIELALCQRYYWVGGYGWTGSCNSSINGIVGGNFAVPMRVVPSINLSGVLTNSLVRGGGALESISGLTNSGSSFGGAFIYFSGSGYTIGPPYSLISNIVAASAEY